MMTSQLEEHVNALERILEHSLGVDNYLNLDLLKRKLDTPRFQPGALGTAAARPSENDFLPTPLSFVDKLVPGARRRFEHALQEGRERFGAAVRAYEEEEVRRQLLLAEARARHEAHLQQLSDEVAEQHRQIDSLKAGIAAHHSDAVASYFSLVLERSTYPDGFPQHANIAYVPESKQLVVEYDLPAFDVVPEILAHKYNKSRDSITEVRRSAVDRRRIYGSVVAQTALRTLHEVFEADRTRAVDTVVLNGHVDAIDAATGRRARPCVVSVRTTRSVFEELELDRVEPVACLRALNASVSKKPEELLPVRPILEFKMVDARFIEEADVLSELDSRPNLMDLTPSEFESLITNLFERMGLETRQTQASRDGGVDCVAYDPRPIFGGKVVIQAKRYKNTVGVGAVRDLFGTLQNEGASKGILVTTSGYGRAAFEFAAGKPIELLSGSNLLYLLAEHAGVEAKIVPPEDWQDPTPESGA
ncbi:MAG TPA: restriction endonuclease [Thermoanaerobaculia bacterium]|nr:restriction endonuclease [Thermoanaerobaculia bacterium]